MFAGLVVLKVWLISVMALNGLVTFTFDLSPLNGVTGHGLPATSYAVLVIVLELVLAEHYEKLQYFVSSVCRTLQGSVCTHIR